MGATKTYAGVDKKLRNLQFPNEEIRRSLEAGDDYADREIDVLSRIFLTLQIKWQYWDPSEKTQKTARFLKTKVVPLVEHVMNVKLFLSENKFSQVIAINENRYHKLGKKIIRTTEGGDPLEGIKKRDSTREED